MTEPRYVTPLEFAAAADRYVANAKPSARKSRGSMTGRSVVRLAPTR